MAEQSPITPSDFDPISPTLLACDYLRALLQSRESMHDFVAWMIQENGELTTDFINALLSQILFDAAKKGWFLQTNVSTGKLELIEKIPLSGLDPTTGVDGDTLVLDGGVWIPQSAPSIYISPSGGGVTLPDPAVGAICSVAHGLSSTPTKIGCQLVCNAAEAGYSIGDVVDATGLLKRGDSLEQRPGACVGANATLLWVVFTNEGAPGANEDYQLPHKSTFDSAVITPGSWNVKLYATL